MNKGTHPISTPMHHTKSGWIYSLTTHKNIADSADYVSTPKLRILHVQHKYQVLCLNAWSLKSEGMHLSRTMCTINALRPMEDLRVTTQQTKVKHSLAVFGW